MKPWEETWHVRQDGMNKDRGIASESEPCVLVRDFGTVEQLHLAAAAPELYRALEAMLLPERCEGDCSGCPDCTEQLRRFNAAAAALRKARGER